MTICLSADATPGINDNCGDVLFLVAPDLIPLRRLPEANAVGNDVAGIDLLLLDPPDY